MNELVGDRYRLEDPIGSGGMAEVWRATDTESGEVVAVKRLHPGIASDATARARFRREVDAARSISHPAVLRVLDADADAAVPWLAMEFVAGGTLADRLREAAMEPAVAVDVAADVASALAAVHAAGLVHRDVTPSNILLPDEHGARLGDFGIARSWGAAGAEDVTLTGDLVGTMRFVAPEVLAGEPAGPPADVWALGAVLHEALTGARTFDASSPAALLDSQHAPPPAPDTAGSRVRDLIDAMLDPDPHRRPTAETAASVLRGEPAPIEAADEPGMPEETVAFATAVPSRAHPPEPSGPAIATSGDRFDTAPVGQSVARRAPAPRPSSPSGSRGRSFAPIVVLASVVLLAAVVLGAATLGNPTPSRAPGGITGEPARTPAATSTPRVTAPPVENAGGGDRNGGGNGKGNGHGKGNGNGKGKDGGG